MNAKEADAGDPAEKKDLIEQSRLFTLWARETLDRAERLVARAQADRQNGSAILVETENRAAMMASLRDMQSARTELVTAIQQTTQAMHFTTRYVQTRERLIQAHVEWNRQDGK